MKAKRYNYTIYIWSFLLLYFIPPESMAQVEQEQNEYRKSFDLFNASIQQDFDTFKHQNDSIFYQFLEQSWVKFNLFKDARPIAPKPQEQPVIKRGAIQNSKIDPIKSRTMLEDSGRQMILNGKPPVYKKNATYDVPTSNTVTFDFYGTPIELDKPQSEKKDNPSISSNEIAKKYLRLTQNDTVLKTIRMLQKQAVKQHLNGWGTLDLFKRASEKLFSSVNDQVLFSWFALLRTGYEARVGYDHSDIYLLAAFDVQAFYRPYFELKGVKYYLVSFQGQNPDLSSITSYEVDYPEKLSYLTLNFERYPEFAFDPGCRTVDYKGEKVRLAYNQNLTNFYGGYPESDLSVYFQPCISKGALKEFDGFLQEYTSDLTPVQKVNFFLDFIQVAFRYQTDEQQFGSENYLFAEETLRYPFADCEDRTVLLDQFVQAYLGAQTIAIIYPGHVLLGVCLEEPVEGTYVSYHDKKYYVADPTYMGAKLGMIMPEFERAKPEIIDLTLPFN